MKKKINARKKSVLKYGISVITLFGISGCGTMEIRFKNKVKGNNPYGLVGDYQLFIHESDTSYIDTLSIQRIKKSNYLFVLNAKDTIYYGDVQKKRSGYYFNQYDEKSEHWDISSFRIKNDSIYNLYYATLGSPYEAISNGYFKDFWKEDLGDDVTYWMNNGKKETLAAFSTMLDSTSGVYFKEIIYDEDTIPAFGEGFTEKSLAEKANSSTTKTVWKAYPNPFTNNITIEQNGTSNSTIRLTSLSGQMIKQGNIDQSTTQWDLAHLQSGTYLLDINNGTEKFKTIKLVKN